MEDFQTKLRRAYSFTTPSLELGNVVRQGKVFPDLPISIPLRMMNRHGLIAGSTGTGKTRTLQVLAESLSRAGVPSFVADVKGDLSGMAIAGEASPRVLERMKGMGREFQGDSCPVEFLSLSGNRGWQVRATVSSFGPILLGKVLDLTDTQQSVLAMVFKYCDDRQMPLLDFKDLRDVLHYLSDEGKSELKDYGGMSPATVGVLVRKMVELEQQGAERFFGEPELDIADLMRTDAQGRGVVNVLTLSDVQDKPRLFSTFLMWLLGRFYYGLPEVGDPDKPKLVFFFDEAHLLFDDSSSALIEQIEQVARLIRSKGIGVFFITQTPKDIDEDVLSQLGNRIQHAVRAFTPQDAKNLRATASTFPRSEYYEIDKTLTSLGIGEALVTVLDPKGIPTEVCATQIVAPRSSMSPLPEADFQKRLGISPLALKYLAAIDRESAHEILKRKIVEAAAAEPSAEDVASSEGYPVRGRSRRPVAKPRKGVVDQVFSSTAGRQMARTAVREMVRGIFGLLRK